MDEIKESLKFGWKEILGTWWWISLSALYIQIGGFLYWFAGFTAARWVNNPEILDKLNYRTFSFYFDSPVGLRWNIGHTIMVFVMFSIFYFFAGYLPSKRAKNKNHSVIMLKTALWFFVLNCILVLFSYLAILFSPRQAALLSFGTVLSQYLSQIAHNVFGITLFIAIALISYIYEKFTEKNVFQLVMVFFVVQTIDFIIMISFRTLSYVNGNVLKIFSRPSLGIFEAIAYSVVFIVAIFIASETVIWNNFKEGVKRGLYLLYHRGNIVWAYFFIYACLFAISFGVSWIPYLRSKAYYGVNSHLFSTAATIIPFILFILVSSFLVVTAFKLAYLFEKRGKLSEEADNGDKIETSP